MWLVLGLGYMFMITEQFSQGQYVLLLRKVSKKISKSIRIAKRRFSTTNINKDPAIRSKSVPAIRYSRSLRVTFPTEKTKNVHKKLCMSASV